MQIFYVHHAMRAKGNPSTQQDGITALGERDAGIAGEILAEYFLKYNKKLVGIFSAPEFRHAETSKLLNTSLKSSVFFDERLSEMKCYDKSESWSAVQSRIRDAIKDVVMKYDDKDACAVMVTSGVNLAGFVATAYKLMPSDEAPFPCVISCSPIAFQIDKSFFEGDKNGRS